MGEYEYPRTRRTWALLNIVCIISISFNLNHAGAAEVCSSPQCKKTAQTILYNMLPTADPCVDFYSFACGGLEDKASIPDYETEAGFAAEVQNEIYDQIESEFNRSYESTPRYSAFEKAQNFYFSCMDENAIEKSGLDALKAQLKRIGGWPVADSAWNDTKFDLTNTKIQLQREGLDTEIVFGFDIVADDDSNKYTLWVHQAVLGLNENFLLQGLQDPLVEAYVEVMVDLAMELGATSRDQAKKDMSDAIELEFYIASLLESNNASADYNTSSNYYNTITIRQLEKDLSFVSWYKLISQSLEGVTSISLDDQILVSEVYLSQLSALLEGIPKRTLANYMIGRAVFAQAPYLTKKMQIIVNKMDQQLYGISSLPPRRDICLEELEDRFEQIVSAVYVRKYFDKEKTSKIEEMVNLLQAELLKVLEAAPFLSPSSLDNSKGKIKKLKYFIGAQRELYDDDVLNDFFENVKTDPAGFYGNVIATNIFLVNYEFSFLHKYVEKAAWYDHSFSTLLDVIYSPQENLIDIPAAITVDNFYSSARPDYLNFALLAFIIGSRQMELFSDLGIQFDEYGNYKPLWDEVTSEEFRSSEDYLGDEYSDYFDPEFNMTLYGFNIESTATADQAGLKIAYQALQNVLSRKEQDSLIHLEKYSSNQLFWLWIANGFCSKIRPEVINQSIVFNDYPTTRFRINGPFRNSPNFTQDWNCPEDTFMNPRTRVNVW